MNTVQNNSIVNGSNEKITYHEFGLKEAEKAQLEQKLKEDKQAKKFVGTRRS